MTSKRALTDRPQTFMVYRVERAGERSTGRDEHPETRPVVPVDCSLLVIIPSTSCCYHHQHSGTTSVLVAAMHFLGVALLSVALFHPATHVRFIGLLLIMPNGCRGAAKRGSDVEQLETPGPTPHAARLWHALLPSCDIACTTSTSPRLPAHRSRMC
eukprot:scaffold109116_cov66-Phaeocystis_antarctica.AAC.3